MPAHSTKTTQGSGLQSPPPLPIKESKAPAVIAAAAGARVAQTPAEERVQSPHPESPKIQKSAKAKVRQKTESKGKRKFANCFCCCGSSQYNQLYKEAIAKLDQNTQAVTQLNNLRHTRGKQELETLFELIIKCEDTKKLILEDENVFTAIQLVRNHIAKEKAEAAAAAATEQNIVLKAPPPLPQRKKTAEPEPGLGIMQHPALTNQEGQKPNPAAAAERGLGLSFHRETNDLRTAPAAAEEGTPPRQVRNGGDDQTDCESPDNVCKNHNSPFSAAEQSTNSGSDSETQLSQSQVEQVQEKTVYACIGVFEETVDQMYKHICEKAPAAANAVNQTGCESPDSDSDLDSEPPPSPKSWKANWEQNQQNQATAPEPELEPAAAAKTTVQTSSKAPQRRSSTTETSVQTKKKSAATEVTGFTQLSQSNTSLVDPPPLPPTRTRRKDKKTKQSFN